MFRRCVFALILSGATTALAQCDILDSQARGVNEAVISRAGKVALIANRGVFLVDSASGKTLQRIRDVRADLQAVAFRPNSDDILVADIDFDWKTRKGSGRVACWKSDGTRRYELSGHMPYVFALAWAPHGRWFATAGGNDMLGYFGWPIRHRSHGEIAIWNGKTGKLLSRVQEKVNVAYAVAVSPGGDWLAALANPIDSGRVEEKRLVVLRLDKAGHIKDVKKRPLDGLFYYLDISPDGKQVAVSGTQIHATKPKQKGGLPADPELRAAVKIWDFEKQNWIAEFTDKKQGAYRSVFASNKAIASVELSDWGTYTRKDSRVRIHDIASKKVIFSQPTSFEGPVLSQDGATAMVAQPGSLKVYDVKSGELLEEYPRKQKPHEVGVREAAFLEDGKTLLIVWSNGDLWRCTLKNQNAGQPTSDANDPLDETPRVRVDTKALKIVIKHKQDLKIALLVTNTSKAPIGWDTNNCVFAKWSITDAQGDSIRPVLSKPLDRKDPKKRFVVIQPGKTHETVVDLSRGIREFSHARKLVTSPTGGAVASPTGSERSQAYPKRNQKAWKVSMKYDTTDDDERDAFAAYFGFRPKTVRIGHVRASSKVLTLRPAHE